MAVHFCYSKHNPTDTKQLRYALPQEYVCTPSPALTSLTLWQNMWGDVCAPVAGAYVLLYCGEIVMTCAHRWSVLMSCYAVKKSEMMRCATDRYLYFCEKVRFVGVMWDTQSRESE